ncbi:MAG TPA: hypothetical protein VFV98_03760 [Vicinamibacterales bacterium]|nr:hypothetical protein [Vicinamibacterales bacterium]
MNGDRRRHRAPPAALSSTSLRSPECVAKDRSETRWGGWRLDLLLLLEDHALAQIPDQINDLLSFFLRDRDRLGDDGSIDGLQRERFRYHGILPRRRLQDGGHPALERSMSLALCHCVQ